MTLPLLFWRVGIAALSSAPSGCVAGARREAPVLLVGQSQGSQGALDAMDGVSRGASVGYVELLRVVGKYAPGSGGRKWKARSLQKQLER